MWLLKGECLDALGREAAYAASVLLAWRERRLKGGTATLKRRSGDRQVQTLKAECERTIYRARKQLGVVVAQSGFGKQKRSIWKLPESPNVAKHPQFCQFCQAKTFGKNGNVGKIGEFIPDDDAEVFEVGR